MVWPIPYGPNYMVCIIWEEHIVWISLLLLSIECISIIMITFPFSQNYLYLQNWKFFVVQDSTYCLYKSSRPEMHLFDNGRKTYFSLPYFNSKYCIQNNDFEIHSRWTKVGCVFPMVISSDFRMGRHRSDANQKDATHFTIANSKLIKNKLLTQWWRHFPVLVDELTPNLVANINVTTKHNWLHRCWWRMLETKCVGEKFEMLVTDSGCWWPI